MSSAAGGAYSATNDLVDYILGITFEIWEQRGIDLIHRYYASDTPVFSLEGLTNGAAAMVDGTRAVLAAYPDRLLLADDVIVAGDAANGYSSHRVVSPMTNQGPTAYGPATGRRLTIMNVADCVVEDGVIVREWLMRDNFALVRQLGFAADAAAGQLASSMTVELDDWFAAETARLKDYEPGPAEFRRLDGDIGELATRALRAVWCETDGRSMRETYAPYAVLHRSAIERYSGLAAVADHYAMLRDAIGNRRFSVDHVIVDPRGRDRHAIALRWALTGTHRGEFLGCEATGQPVYVAGVTHWHVVAGRVAIEWTVFDSLAVLAQLKRRR